MPHVAPGLIAVATGPIAYTEVDENGKAVAETVIFAKGDLIHDEALVKTLHDKHFHHALTVTPHSEHLCPDDCEKAPRAPQVEIARLPVAAISIASSRSVSQAVTFASASASDTTGVN